MNAKKIIPRKDHEVYFIPMPEDLKARETQRFVFNALSELHPGFSATTDVDIQSLVFNKKRWFMATVMASETLAEYKMLCRGAVFYTNTSIMIHDKDFIQTKPLAVDDELIGFDVEKNVPVSVPLDETDSAGSQSLLRKLGYVSSRHGVFVKRKPKGVIAGILASIAVMTFMIFLFISVGNTAGQEGAVVEDHVEQPPEITWMPTAISILAKVSESILNAEGEIERWQYNENTDPCIVLQCKNIQLLTAHEIFDKLDYLSLQDFQNVIYIDGIPWVTIAANAKQDAYSLPVSSRLPVQSEMLSVLTEFIDLLSSQGITVVSETLPSAGNGYGLYTVTYTAGDSSLVRSMEIIEEFCKKYTLRVRNLDMVISADKNMFTVICALSFNTEHGSSILAEMRAIPGAFGYVPVKQAAPYVAAKPASITLTEQVADERPVVGKIRDYDEELIYFRNTDGKINTGSNR